VKIEHGRSVPCVFCFKAEQARQGNSGARSVQEEKGIMNPPDQGDILEAGLFFACLSLFSASPSLIWDASVPPNPLPIPEKAIDRLAPNTA